MSLEEGVGAGQGGDHSSSSTTRSREEPRHARTRPSCTPERDSQKRLRVSVDEPLRDLLSRDEGAPSASSVGDDQHGAIAPEQGPAAPARALSPSQQKHIARQITLADWCDRPLVLPDLLEEDEIPAKFNYIPGIPLVACASEGQSALLRHLLRQEGVDPGVRDLNGNTALGLATANGRSEAAGLLRTAQAAGAREDGVAAQGAPA
ncbi:hypothetical protein ACKKBG_A20395 [Auxenochlorella protothecoides x Auxenochlorella symbiontica]